jgi:hypothetical protein
VVTAEELAQSPAWFPLEHAGEASVRLVRLDEAAYRAASFLDRRILGARIEERICSAAALRAAAAPLAPRLDYIFHIGHVGSTLVSRLVGEHEGFFSVREPAMLREIAGSRAPQPLGLETLLRLLARTWRPAERTVVKPTSFVSEIASQILARSEEAAAVFMYAQPASYLRGILGGPNSRIEAQRLAPSRLERLEGRLGAGEWLGQLTSEGEYLAMSWLCEMAALHEAGAADATDRTGVHADRRALWMDFDAFLADPVAGLSAILLTLGAAPSRDKVEALVSGPVMRQYSKAPEHPYDTDLRREVLAAAEEQYGAEVRRGLEWLQRAAARHPLIAQVLQAADSGRQASWPAASQPAVRG